MKPRDRCGHVSIAKAAPTSLGIVEDIDAPAVGEFLHLPDELALVVARIINTQLQVATRCSSLLVVAITLALNNFTPRIVISFPLRKTRRGVMFPASIKSGKIRWRQKQGPS
jgi:hypothetical protein